VARLGGDEFMFILENIVDGMEVRIICDRIQQGLRVPFSVAGQEIVAQVSIGITLFPDDGDEVESLMKNCDMAMYQGKSNGKNSYCFFIQAMNEALQGRIRMAHDLRNAVRQDEFVLYYQPKIDIARGIITGSEALIRWIRQDGIYISPEQFIPVAESSGAIHDIGDWVLESAIRQNKEWNNMGFPDLNIAVNISASEFQRDNLLVKLREVLDATGMNPQNVTLEITEHIIVEDVNKALAVMTDLSALGVGIALDDFGTGYSSLNYLQHFPLTILKIDKSFVENLSGDNEDKTIASAIISLAHNLSLSVVSEGVEKL
jgi:predicted signal transduction protein with EAL and GGDEF domain